VNPSGAAPSARVPALDALRGVAILAVVALHVTFDYLRQAPLPSRVGTVMLALHLLTGFAVPLFVALSTASLSLGHSGVVRTAGDYGAFLAVRARRILPPYLAWSLVMIARDHPSALFHPTTVAFLLLTGGAHYHLYFVPLVCQLYVLWPLLAPLGRGAASSAGATLALAIGGLAASLGWWRLSGAGLVPNVTLTLVPLWLGYATLGLAAVSWVRSWVARVQSGWTGLVIATSAAIVAAAVMIGYVYLQVVQSPEHVAIAVTIFQAPSALYALSAMALGLIVVARLEQTAAHAVLAGLGRRSYGIYLVHPLVLEMIVYRIVGRPDPHTFAVGSWSTALVLSWAACVALSDGVVRLLAASATLRPLSGVAPRV
jgi:peptidoglycan/LPS O-acetylase OafA/YrhL